MSGTVQLSHVVDDVRHWSAIHPGIGQEVHSYYVADRRLVIDPVGAPGLVDALGELGGVERVALTNRHHLRGAGELVEAFGCDVRAPAAGMHEFEDSEIEVLSYEWGGELAEGVIAHQVSAICPDDGSLEIRGEVGSLAVADGVIRWDGELAFVPDFLMEDPHLVKKDQLEALERLLSLDFEALLLAHGPPIASGAKDAIRRFIESPRSADFSG